MASFVFRVDNQTMRDIERIYKDSDKILIRACLLPVACFNEIIKFCMK